MGVSLFFGLNVGVNAMESMQQAESVISNNIANANTPGYVQERGVLTESTPFPPASEFQNPGQFGEGSSLEHISRQTSAFVNQQDRQNQGIAQMYITHDNGLQQIQGILNEPSSNSVQNAVDQFFSSWQTLSSDPSSIAARQTVISQAQTLSQTFQTVTSQLEQLQTSVQAKVDGAPFQYFDQIGTATLNSSATSPSRNIADAVSVSPIANPPQAYQLVFKASGTATGNNYQLQLQTPGAPPTTLGSVNVTGAGKYSFSVNGSTVAITMPDPLTLLPVGFTNSSTYSQTDNVASSGGEFAQLNSYASQVDALNRQIVTVNQNGGSPNQLLDQRGSILDKMAKLANITYAPSNNPSFAGAVSVQLGGVRLVSDTGGTTAFPSASANQVSSGTIAGDLSTISDTQQLLQQIDSFLNAFSAQVNSIQSTGYPLSGSATAPNLLTVSNDTLGHTRLNVANSFTPQDVAAADQPNQPGNNNNVTRMVGLQSGLVYQGGTFDQGLSSMVAGVGVEAASVKSSLQTANALAQQSTSMRQSISGVDINEQAALMVQYQNSFNAAAKFISVTDQMLQTLINMG